MQRIASNIYIFFFCQYKRREESPNRKLTLIWCRMKSFYVGSMDVVNSKLEYHYTHRPNQSLHLLCVKNIDNTFYRRSKSLWADIYQFCPLTVAFLILFLVLLNLFLYMLRVVQSKKMKSCIIQMLFGRFVRVFRVYRFSLTDEKTDYDSQ